MQDEIKQLVLVDDHHLLRRGFRSLLGGEPGLEVVGEASTGQEAIEICRRLEPDLVLMDVRMPEMDGMTATRQIKREQPSIMVGGAGACRSGSRFRGNDGKGDMRRCSIGVGVTFQETCGHCFGPGGGVYHFGGPIELKGAAVCQLAYAR
jgi:CheY-like chemotaxis protein